MKLLHSQCKDGRGGTCVTLEDGVVFTGVTGWYALVHNGWLVQGVCTQIVVRVHIYEHGFVVVLCGVRRYVMVCISLCLMVSGFGECHHT